MKKIDLNGKWMMSGNGYRVEGNIPGSVFSFLHVDNNILPDPYFRDNEDIYLKAASSSYTFERTFTLDNIDFSARLVFEGLDTLCTVYLNGKEILSSDNMHVRYEVEVSDILRRGENTISVVFQPIDPFIKQKNAKSKLFGATDCMEGYPHVRKAHSMMGWDWGPRLPDMGIWRSVYLLVKDSPEITDFYITQIHEGERVFLTPFIQADSADEISLTLISPSGERQELVPNKKNEVKAPKLWWPNGYGEQNIYTAEARLVQNGETVDERELKIGLRTLNLIRKEDELGESFYHEVNGVDVFAMGADYIPEDNIFSRITKERTRELLTSCKDSHFNAIRVWGGGYYPDDWFFDLCDELGLIVFFDLMFACSVYEPDQKMRSSIEVEVRQNIRRIRNHACIGVVCGNNEIEWHFKEYVAISGRSDLDRLTDLYLDLFENLLPNIVREEAPWLAYIPSSPTSGGAFENPNGEQKGDCHDWDADYLLCRGRFYRYVSEFGFQALPHIKTVEGFTEEKDRNFNSKIMDRHQRSFGGNELIFKYLIKNYPHPNGLENAVYFSQLLQGEAVKYKVEHFRRNRGRSMGTLYWQLNDIWPCTSWASIDYNGRYKALQYFAKRFYSPILLSCEEVGYMQNRPYINTEKGLINGERSARLCITNDTLNDISGKVRWEVRDNLSEVILSGEQDVTVKALSAKYLDKMYFEDLNTETEHLYFELNVGGVVVSSGSVLFDVVKYHEFKSPDLRLEVEGDEIIVKSNAFAKNVFIDNTDGRIILSDNYFDMEKGQKRVKILKGNPIGLTARSVYEFRK